MNGFIANLQFEALELSEIFKQSNTYVLSVGTCSLQSGMGGVGEGTEKIKGHSDRALNNLFKVHI